MCEAALNVPDNIANQQFSVALRGTYRLVVNGRLAEWHKSLDSARNAASAIGKALAAAKSTSLRISVETAECEEVYALVIINDCEDLMPSLDKKR